MPLATIVIASIIGAAGSTAGAVISRTGRGGSAGSTGGSAAGPAITPEQAAADKAFQDQLQSLIGSDSSLQTISDFQRHFGKKNTKAGLADFRAADDYWTQLLSGDRTAVAQRLGPDLARVSDQYDAARKTISEFSPRGGGRGAALTNLSTQQAAQTGDAFLRAKPEAAQAMERLAVERSAAGSGALSASANSIGQMLSALLGGQSEALQARGLGVNQQAVDLQAQQQRSSALGGLGGSLGNILLAILRSRGGGSGVSPGFGELPGLGGAPGDTGGYEGGGN